MSIAIRIYYNRQVSLDCPNYNYRVVQRVVSHDAIVLCDIFHRRQEIKFFAEMHAYNFYRMLSQRLVKIIKLNDI